LVFDCLKTKKGYMEDRMAEFHQLDRYIKDHLSENLSELGRLCAQPSVSAQNWGLQECAALVGEMLQQRGFEVQIIPTGGAPVVLPSELVKAIAPCSFTTTMMSSPLNRWNCGKARRLNLRFEMGKCMRAASATIKVISPRDFLRWMHCLLKKASCLAT
jgi:hypothetical protein